MLDSVSCFWRRLGALLATILAMATFSSAASAAPCASNCLVPGDYLITTLYQGLPRSYLVHVPPSYTGQRDVALLVDFHGGGREASNERQYSGQLEQSNQRGFIVVYPNGIGLVWNAYGCCLYANTLAIDDVGFTRSLIASIKNRAAIDADRVFVTGISNGGGMAHRMACETADMVRAAVSVSYPLNTNNCRPSRPVNIAEIAGTADTNIPYDGNESPLPPFLANTLGMGSIQGARQSLAAWKQINGCTDDLYREQLPAGTQFDGSRLEEYRSCSGGVRTSLVTIANGRHVLYNGYTDIRNGYYDGDNAPINVASYIWDTFFDR